MQFIENHGDSETQKSKSKGWLLWSGLIVAILVAVGGYFVWQSLSEKPPAEPAPAPAPPPEPEPAPEPEPEPTEEAPTTGSLVVSSNQEGSVVFIDGVRAGSAPYRESGMEPGTYKIRIVKEGFDPFEQEVRIVAGRRVQVGATFEKAVSLLRVDSDVPGASVFLDRNYVGTTPVEVSDIDPGEHELTASADGYDMYAETLELSDEPRDVMIRFKQVTLDESVAVIHKHTFGQCQGTLSTTLTHVTYDTDHKDAFSVPWAGLERFEVDYIEKNLNIKVNGGKNYNFTSQSGNPDELFVFHQKVTEAREKLKALN